MKTPGARITALALLAITATIVETASAQTIFAGNTSSSRIETYNGATGALINSSFISGVNAFDIAVDQASNRLYVVDSNTGNISAYNAGSGAALTTFTPIAQESPFAFQYSIAVQSGVLYRLGFGQVSSYDAATGAVINNVLTGTEGSFIAANINSIFTVGAEVNSFNRMTGQDATKLLSPSDFFPTPFMGQDIAANGDTLYIANRMTNSVISANATNGAIITSNLAATTSISRISFYDGLLYTTSSASGSGNKILAFNSVTGNALNGFTPVSSSDVYRGIAVIPEPSACALFVSGLCAFWFLALRRRAE